jgi:hypothetical protein
MKEKRNKERRVMTFYTEARNEWNGRQRGWQLLE